jgi:mannose-6-phosphate isomerase-like protein (cupin superfamily)
MIMTNYLFQKLPLRMSFLALSFCPILAFSAEDKSVQDIEISPPTVVNQIFEESKRNDNWKSAFLTGKEAQVVFMHVSPKTNPKNEIGVETHGFDQVILIAEGNAKIDLNGKMSTAKIGDLVFVPQGTPHNLINLNKDKPLKIISIYSRTDIPAHSQLKKSSDTATKE